MDIDLSSFIKGLMGAGTSHNWHLVAAMVLMGAVFLARKYGAKVFPWLGTDRGGVTLVMAGAFVGAFVSAFQTGAKFSTDLILQALTMASTAAGGFAVIKKAFWPSDKPPAA